MVYIVNHIDHFCAVLLYFNSFKGGKIDDAFSNKHGVHNFKIHGSIYHLIGSLLPDDSDKPSCAQIYMYDTDYQIESRSERFSQLDIDLIREIQNALLAHNPYVSKLRYVSQVIKENGNLDIRLMISTNKDIDMRRYNTPGTSEVAVLLPGDGLNANNRDIVLYKQGGGLKRINEFNACYDPLHYILLFPFGDQGYHFVIKPHEIINDSDFDVNLEYENQLLSNAFKIFF